MPGVYKRKDHLYEKAKAAGYRSRAAYKLLELNKKFRLLTPGATVLDLGCFPGGWLQVSQEKVGDGLVIGIDLNEVEPLAVNKNMTRLPVIIHGDLNDAALQNEIENICGGRVDLVLSDMSPKLSGIRFRDAALSAELLELAFRMCERFLRPGGKFVAKVFQGQETDDLIKKMRARFERISRENLDSSRKSSTELYVVAQEFRA